MNDEQSTTSPKQPVVEVVPGGPIHGRIRPPGSKSLTNRALICAAMADGKSRLSGALRSEDTIVMIDALRAIGVSIDVADGGRLLVVDPQGRNSPASPTANTATTDSGTTDSGTTDHLSTSNLSVDGVSASRQTTFTGHDPIELFIANSGTTVRFLSAALSAAGGHYRLHGVPRMHQRPIGDLIDALVPIQSGTIRAESDGGCPPVLIESGGWNVGSTIRVAGSVSSQYLSGLMMASPVCGREVRIEVSGELVSRPYVEMTAEVMRCFGAQVRILDGPDKDTHPVTIEISEGGYQGVEYEIEPDASAASYFWATAAITGGSITVDGLGPKALQGDVGFCDVLEQMGCRVDRDADSMTVHGGHLRGIDVDMNAISDTVQTLSVVALFADGPTRVRGVAHNRFKETDRIGDLAHELRKLGARIDEHDDGLTIHPAGTKTNAPDFAGATSDAGMQNAGLHGATLQTYHDHRMAMSLSLAGLRIAGVRILDPSCTSKTYPEYFADLESLIGRPHRWTGQA
tara:strand:- start:52806 stop:54353 length:1548 start_codon:yes stop_codon:yes gene_type:complete